MAVHKSLSGMLRFECEREYLTQASRREFYGCRVFYCKDSQNRNVRVAVGPAGVSVYTMYQKLSTYSWTAIVDVSFNKKMFLLKFKADGQQLSATYMFETVEECKVC